MKESVHNYIEGTRSGKTEEIMDHRAKLGNERKPKFTSLKKMYYIERICQYKGNNIVSNKFVMSYSLALLDKLGVKPESFLNGLISYSLPVTIRPLENLIYRYHLISHMIFGNFPRMDTKIEFISPDRIITLDPYLTVNRSYSLQEESLKIKCVYSYKDDDDLRILKRKEPRKIEPDEDRISFLKENLNSLYRGVKKF